MKTIYLVGSLRNPEIPTIGNKLRALGYDVFDDWHAAGATADDEWKRYETERGHTYREGLKGWAAKHVFEFDLHHLQRSDLGVLVLPAGRSGHLELGFLIGSGKPGYVLLDNPDRWDVMYQFATGIFFSLDEMIKGLTLDNNT
jgi:nucleoside 2-deoxyribosyltransferase